MEEIYANVDAFKQPAKGREGVTQLSLNSGCRQKSSKRFNKWCHLFALAFLSLLSFSLLTGLVVVCVLNHDRTDLVDIRQNLTERLEISNLQIFSLTEERNQLRANLTEMSGKIARLQTLLPDVCPTGWDKFRSSCYFLSDRTGSWDEGREDCKQRGADLVVIESSEEKDFLAKLTQKYTWIGLNDREQEGSWKWVNGAPLDFAAWEKSQPDNWNGDPKCPEEDCVHIAAKSMWNDLSCTSSHLWICERNAGKPL